MGGGGGGGSNIFNIWVILNSYGDEETKFNGAFLKSGGDARKGRKLYKNFI